MGKMLLRPHLPFSRREKVLLHRHNVTNKGQNPKQYPFYRFHEERKWTPENIYKCNNLHLALANAGRFHEEIKCTPNLAFSRTDKCVCLQNKQF